MLDLAFGELRLYGGERVQIVGRMARALSALTEAVPPKRRAAVERQVERLRHRIATADPGVRQDLERALSQMNAVDSTRSRRIATARA